MHRANSRDAQLLKANFEFLSAPFFSTPKSPAIRSIARFRLRGTQPDSTCDPIRGSGARAQAQSRGLNAGTRPIRFRRAVPQRSEAFSPCPHTLHCESFPEPNLHTGKQIGFVSAAIVSLCNPDRS